MKIAYVTNYDPNDVRNRSGVAVFMSAAFERIGHTVERIGPLKETAAGPSLAKRQLYKALGKRYLRDRDPTRLRSYARQVEHRLAASDCDVVVSPGSIPLSYVRIDKPMVFWADASFAGMAEYYAEFSNLPARTTREGNAAEQAALSGCTLAIYASEWARHGALEHYDVDPAKVRVVPRGANLAHAPTRDEVEQMIAARSREKCTLLFLAADWGRKGGRKAFEVTESLNAVGIPAELVVAGGAPDPSVLASPHVTYLGFVGKDTPDGLAQFATMFAGAHCSLLPTMAEAFGISSCEANAYGVPALVNDVGGTSGAVTDGLNGKLFAPDAPADVWRDYIAPLWSDRDRYTALARASVDEYARRLNWETGCRAVLDMLTDALPARSVGGARFQ